MLLAQEGAMQEPLFELDATVVTFITGALLPLLVGVITKLHLHSGVKAVIHAFLSAISAMIITSTTLEGVAVISRETLVTAFITWLVGVAAHFGFWTPTTVTPKLNHNTADFGIGPTPVHKKAA
jgi:hypothetical protein